MITIVEASVGLARTIIQIAVSTIETGFARADIATAIRVRVIADACVLAWLKKIAERSGHAASATDIGRIWARARNEGRFRL